MMESVGKNNNARQRRLEKRLLRRRVKIVFK